MTYELKERKKYQKITSAIFVLTVGEYSRLRIQNVSANAKFIAEKYVENIDNSPEIQIWRHNERLGSFYEYKNKNIQQIIKAISKKAMLKEGEYVQPEGSIYTFTTGEYSRTVLRAVSSDIKLISELYAKNYKEKPYIEIWNNGDFKHCFGEYTDNSKNITKVVSMKSQGIKTKKDMF